MKKKIDYSNNITPIVIIVIGIFASIFSYLYFKNYLVSLFLVAGFICIGVGSYYYKNYHKRKTSDEQLQNLKDLFKAISSYKSLTKEQLLDLNIPLEFRVVLERSLSVKVDYNDYLSSFDKNLPARYQKMILGLYFLVEDNSKDEFDNFYKVFNDEENNLSKSNCQKKYKLMQALALYSFLAFILIILVFMFPTIKEIIYG